MATREVMVIGAGPAGVAAAIEAARAGCGVTMIAEEPVGGRATHASLVPSKVLLHFVHERRKSKLELEPSDVVQLTEEMARVARIESERAARRLEDAGVRMVRGVARLTGPGSLEIAREGSAPRAERCDAVVIATGSGPSFPPGFFGDAKGPDGERILAPRHLRTLRSLPKTMMVIGGGATGAELVHAFQAMGVEVTWILDDLGILPDFDRELADSIGDVLMERGVKIVHGKAVLKLVSDPHQGVLASLDGGRTYSAERAMVAIGRRADTARLGLETVGIAIDPRTGAIAVDGTQRAASTGEVFVAGDAAGPPYVQSKGVIEGWIAGRAAAGLAVSSAPRAWVETVYTSPEIAMVGLTPARAGAARRAFDMRTISFDESLRGILADVGVDPHVRGMLRVVLDEATRAVIGASAIGPHASEVLGPVAVAIAAGMTVEQLAMSGLASPTFGELAGAAARS